MDITRVVFEAKLKLKLYHALVLAYNTADLLLGYIASPTDLFVIDAVISLGCDGSWNCSFVATLPDVWTQQILPA